LLKGGFEKKNLQRQKQVQNHLAKKEEKIEEKGLIWGEYISKKKERT